MANDFSAVRGWNGRPWCRRCFLPCPAQSFDGRIATTLLWTAGLFAIFTVHAIYSRDDAAGIVMTAAPGAICAALWYLARARADYLAAGERPSKAVSIVCATLIGAGLLALVLHRRFVEQPLVVVYDDRPTFPLSSGLHERVDWSKLEIVDKPAPNGGTIRTLARKKTEAPKPDCSKWTDPPGPGETNPCWQESK